MKPAVKGMAASDRHPANISHLVTGSFLPSPDMVRRSRLPANACMTLPAVRNSKALKHAWVERWNTPAAGARAATPKNM